MYVRINPKFADQIQKECILLYQFNNEVSSA